VHVIGLVDGAFPSDLALASHTGLAEERRLFYVALTRARDDLRLYTPLRMPHQRYTGSDRHSLAPPSRFLTDAALDTLDVVETAPAQPTPRRALTTARVGIPTMDDLWS
jgi:DNA helicase-2/ATP-dependent DNA helicase PcrA